MNCLLTQSCNETSFGEASFKKSQNFIRSVFLTLSICSQIFLSQTLSYSLSLSLSFPLSILSSLSHSLSLSLSHTCSLFSLSLFFFLFPSLSLSIYIHIYMYICSSLSLSPSLSSFLLLSFSLYFYRCDRCGGYVNPSVSWIDGGNKWTCNMCGFSNSTPPWYEILTSML